MRDEDEEFADIVKQEFNEHWDGGGLGAGSATDFHLNLYDDEESYRQVEASAWTITGKMRWGLALIIVGVTAAIAKIAAPQAPAWMGWTGIVSFIVGTGLCLWQVIHTPARDDDEGTV